MRQQTIAIFTLIVSILSICGVRAESLSNQIDTVATDVASAVSTDSVESVSPQVLWSSAEKAYIEGRYADAVAGYKAILEQGLYSAELYYNLGNAHFKNNELGWAILFYNRAFKLSPSDEDIEHNLNFARSKTKDKIEQIPEFFLSRWMKGVRSWMQSDTWTILSLALLAVAAIAFLLFRLALQISTRKVGFYVMLISLVMCILTTIFAISSRNALLEDSGAVIMSTAVSVKSSPDKNATELFVLHEGTEVTVGESADGWVEVRIADGRKGWIEDSRIERI